MTSPRITFTYSGPSGLDDLLQIEQSDWSAYTGRVTKGGMILSLREMLYGEDAGNVVDCGMTGGEVLCLIDVYPRRPGLVYQFAASYGRLSDRREEEARVTETRNFSLETSVSPSYPPFTINRAEWADAVYDVEGNEITPPALTIEDGKITCPSPVYGAVDITYTTERHSYTLNLPRRETALDNFYSAAVYGWYEGGVDWLEVELPPGIEVFEADPDAVCGGWSGSSDVIWPDEEQGLPDVSAHRYTVVDYCTQEIVEDTTT